MDYATLTQDANGRPIENVVRQLPNTPVGNEIVINEYNDIQWAWNPNLRDPLKNMPKRTNPNGLMRQGMTLLRAPDQAKVIRFLPHTEGQKMTIRYKRYYSYFQPDDIVPMDEQLMILGACYDYLEDDGTNSGQTEKFRNMFNDRLRQKKGDENDREIPLSPMPYENNDGWQVTS